MNPSATGLKRSTVVGYPRPIRRAPLGLFATQRGGAAQSPQPGVGKSVAYLPAAQRLAMQWAST